MICPGTSSEVTCLTRDSFWLPSKGAFPFTSNPVNRLNGLMSGSCHLDNVEIYVKCQIFVIVIFFNCGRVLQFGTHSRYYKGALTQKRLFLVICTTFRSDFCVVWKNQNKHSTLNLSFDALSKWHEPDINRESLKLIWNCLRPESNGIHLT